MINQIEVHCKWRAHSLGVSKYCQMMRSQINNKILIVSEFPFIGLLDMVGQRNRLHLLTLKEPEKHPFDQ